MSLNFNLYEELGLIKTATQEEIKKAFRKLAMVDNYRFIFVEISSRQKQRWPWLHRKVSENIPCVFKYVIYSDSFSFVWSRKEKKIRQIRNSRRRPLGLRRLHEKFQFRGCIQLIRWRIFQCKIDLIIFRIL